MKPAEEYYVKALEKFGIDPVHCVIIDDLKENVCWGRGFGDFLESSFRIMPNCLKP